MSHYLVIYGRTPDLARKELVSVYPNLSVKFHTTNRDILSELPESPEEMCTRLGGIVRICEILDTVQQIDPVDIARRLLEKYPNDALITFALSLDGEQKSLSPSLYAEIKRNLTEHGKSVRYINPNDSGMTSALKVSVAKMTEYVFAAEPGGYILSQTCALQKAHEWSDRDYERPVFDSKRGMLPPKIARMVVNIAAGDDPHGKQFADPFCGMGTVVSEGYVIGGSWYASDLSLEAVYGTKKNLEWVQKHEHLTQALPTVFQQDAVHLSDRIPAESLDAIVTEPFLGDPAMGEKKVAKEKIQNILKGLEKMYLGCLKDWYPLLKPGGKIIMAFPLVSVGEDKQTVKKPIDRCEKLGYSIEAGPFEYGRDKAVVKRLFYIFKKG